MNRGSVIAILIAVLAVMWIASGQFGNLDEASVAGSSEDNAVANEPAGGSEEAAVPGVRVIESVAQPRIQQINLFGRTEAERYVDIRVETDGRIVALNVAEGDLIEEGTAIVRLALNGKQARVKDAEAQFNYRKVAYEAAEELSKKQFRSEVKLAEERAALSAARATLAMARVELARTRINAPFGGVVGELYVEQGQVVRVGDAIVRIDDLDPIVVVAQITEREIVQVEPGQRAQIKLASGEEYSGVVSYIAHSADSITRTFRIEIRIANPEIRIWEGLTAEIELFAKPVMAHRVSPAVLTLNDLGLIGVKTVDGDDRVNFYAVEIIADTTDGIWIKGLPEKSRVISVGQEFVLQGQIVNPVNAGS